MRNIQKDALTATLKTTIEEICLSSRACIFETGPLTYFDYSKNFQKLHACGFNAAEGNLPKNEKLRLIKKYAEHYASLGIKTYIRSIADKKTFETASKAGFAYISGSIIGAATKTPQPLKKLPLSEIG